MATVREGVMRKEELATPAAGELREIAWQSMVRDTDLAVRIVERHIEERKINIKLLELLHTRIRAVPLK